MSPLPELLMCLCQNHMRALRFFPLTAFQATCCSLQVSVLSCLHARVSLLLLVLTPSYFLLILQDSAGGPCFSGPPLLLAAFFVSSTRTEIMAEQGDYINLLGLP